jgi:Carboxypeptidase regulatory-like domain
MTYQKLLRSCNLFRIIALFTLLIASAISSFAQAGRGAISGIVTDSAGAAVPDVMVTIEEPATGLHEVTRTSATGSFSEPSLPVGRYTINVSKPKFETEKRTGIAVNVATTTRVDVQLQLGQTRQVVEVNTEAPIVVSDRSDLGTVFDTQEILKLPLSPSGGLRDNFSFTILNPATVMTPGNDNSLRVGGGLGMDQSMLLDGGETMSERRNDSSFQAVSTDAIGEFKLISNAFSAEYGRMSNGVLDFTTKSGANEPHGSLFEYFRNTDLNARQFFSADRSVVQQEQLRWHPRRAGLRAEGIRRPQQGIFLLLL